MPHQYTCIGFGRFSAQRFDTRKAKWYRRNKGIQMSDLSSKTNSVSLAIVSQSIASCLFWQYDRGRFGLRQVHYLSCELNEPLQANSSFDDIPRYSPLLGSSPC